jgi:hypothetical protein
MFSSKTLHSSIKNFALISQGTRQMCSSVWVCVLLTRRMLFLEFIYDSALGLLCFSDVERLWRHKKKHPEPDCIATFMPVLRLLWPAQSKKGGFSFFFMFPMNFPSGTPGVSRIFVLKKLMLKWHNADLAIQCRIFGVSTEVLERITVNCFKYFWIDCKISDSSM